MSSRSALLSMLKTKLDSRRLRRHARLRRRLRDLATTQWQELTPASCQVFRLMQVNLA